MSITIELFNNYGFRARRISDYDAEMGRNVKGFLVAIPFFFFRVMWGVK